jgi:hypothetical protein
LKSPELRELSYPTPFFPSLSVLHNGQWENAPTGMAPTAPDAARIFDSIAVNSTSGRHPVPGLIPLHPDHPNYSDKLYWRLPKTTIGGILSAAAWKVIMTPPSTNESFKMLQILYHGLGLKATGIDLAR